MPKCLITGGAGFIGSHLVEYCLEKGFDVIVLDDLSTGKRENLPLDHPSLVFIHGDVTDQRALTDVGRVHAPIDYIFHLAAIASVTRSMEDPVHTHRVNFEGTLLLLERFKYAGIKKIVYASSAAIYGETHTVPVSEDALPAPMSPYGADKLHGEHYLKIYNDAFNLPTVACRFFNVFGERQDPSSPYSGVISIFFDRSIAKKNGDVLASINIFGDGEQTRDFIYVKDVVAACLYLAENRQIRGDVFNVGYGKRISVYGLARKIREVLDVDIPINFKDPREGDIRHSQAEVRKLMGAGFKFTYNLEEGLQRLAAYLLPREQRTGALATP